MKKHFLFLLLCLLSLPLALFAQVTEQVPLQLSHHKTTSLVFPYAVKSVDRGSPDILAQVPAEARNVLQVKAARSGFRETNLTVITSDGRLYCFPVSYAPAPARTVIRLTPAGKGALPVLVNGSGLHEEQLNTICAQLAGDSRFYYGIRDRSSGFKATVEGIYTYGNTLFYRVVLANHSPVPYELDFLRITVQDRKQARRTAAQEQEVQPLYLHGLEERQIAAGYTRVLIIALEKTAITRKKQLVLDLFEQQGGRHLKLRVRHRHILQAPPLLLDHLLNYPSPVTVRP